jgi:hypothetical protein
MQTKPRLHLRGICNGTMPKCLRGMCHGVILIGVLFIVFGLQGAPSAWPQHDHTATGSATNPGGV